MKAGVFPATLGEKPLLARLMQLYLHDLSEYVEDIRLTEAGEFPYDWLDHYWFEAGRYPYLIRASGELAGFALVREVDGGSSMAEFFVLRNHRRTGVGRSAVAGLFAKHPGKWSVQFARGNERAAPFWGHVCSAAALPGTLVLTDVGGGESAYRFTVV